MIRRAVTHAEQPGGSCHKSAMKTIKSSYFSLFILVIVSALSYLLWVRRGWITQRSESFVHRPTLTAEVRYLMLKNHPDAFNNSSQSNHSFMSVERTCKPVHDIFFLKTHKCASSSLQNIFMRYGKYNNLTFVLPSFGNYLGFFRKFFRTMMMEHPRGEYNIFCHHTRYNPETIRPVMPKAKFVSIVRHPADLLESFYSFSKYDKRYGTDFDTYIRNPRMYFDKAPRAMPPGRNTMMFDFGLDFEHFDNERKIEEKINSIKNEFELIMIAEYFDESLVLLRDLLCWDWIDVVVFKVNARFPGKKTQLTEEQRHLIESWSSADMKLYSTFKEIFFKKIEEFGKERMAYDLVTLHNKTQEVYDHCVSNMVTKDEIQNTKLKSWSPDVYNFKLKSNDTICIDLAKAELPFTTELKRKLWPNRTFTV